MLIPIWKIIYNYIDYTDENLYKLSEKNAEIRIKIRNEQINFLQNQSLFDIILKCVSLFSISNSANDFEFIYNIIQNKYEKCNYNHLYSIYKYDSKIEVVLNFEEGHL